MSAKVKKKKKKKEEETHRELVRELLEIRCSFIPVQDLGAKTMCFSQRVERKSIVKMLFLKKKACKHNSANTTHRVKYL